MTIHTPTSRVGTEPPRLQQFVGGAWVASAGDSWIDDRNPSDASDLVAYVPEGAPEDARRARGMGRCHDGDLRRRFHEK